MIDSLASCLWHSTLDFYEYGLSKKGLFSPFTYLLPIFNYDPRYADTEELKNHLEERAIKTKVDILKTYAHRFSDTSMLILKRLVPVPALITHISEYAYTAASSIPKRIDSRNFTSWSQDMTIYMEGKLCRYYGIRRDENSILKGRSYYDNNNATERTAVFKCDLFLRSFDMTELKDVDIANLSKEHCTPTLMREDDVFWIYRIAKDGDWQWTKLKLSFEEATLLNQLPFEKEIIKRTDTRFPNVVDLLKKHEVDFEQKNIIQQFRSVRFAPLV